MSAEALDWALGLEYRQTIPGEPQPAPTKRHPIPFGVPLTATEKHVLTVLAWRCNDRDEFGAWPSQSKLAAETNLDRRTVRHALRVLDQSGVITRRPRANSKRLTFEYRLNISQETAASAA